MELRSCWESRAEHWSLELFLGNRGFFPASLLASAREEMTRMLKAMGHELIVLDAAALSALPGALEVARAGEQTGGGSRNREFAGEHVRVAPDVPDDGGLPGRGRRCDHTRRHGKGRPVSLAPGAGPASAWRTRRSRRGRG